MPYKPSPTSTLIGFCLWLCAGGCGPNDEPSRTLDVLVTDFGGTCGEWQTGKGTQRIVANCGDGMACVGWFATYPADQVGNHYGRCLPPTAVCDATDITDPSGACPDKRLTCLVGLSAPPPGACFVHCTVAQDCPGPYQVCVSGGCQFQGCSTSTCSQGAHCENEVCAAD